MNGVNLREDGVPRKSHKEDLKFKDIQAQYRAGDVVYFVGQNGNIIRSEVCSVAIYAELREHSEKYKILFPGEEEKNQVRYRYFGYNSAGNVVELNVDGIYRQISDIPIKDVVPK